MKDVQQEFLTELVHEKIRESLADPLKYAVSRTGSDDLFTATELRKVFETWEGPIDPSNFRKRIRRWLAEDRLEETGSMRPTSTRPASIYRFVR